MRCPKCHVDLGEGMLPARCPECGANLAVGANTHEAAAGARRTTASYAGNDIPRRSGGGNIIRALVAILLVAIAGVLASFVLYQLEFWGGRTLPDVCGMRLELANAELEAAGFTSRVETRKDDGQAGIVLEMSPAAGDRMADGTQVLLYVSEQRAMPDVVGKHRDEAQQLMDAEGIPCEFVEEISDEAEGTVLGSTSPVGTVLTSESLVTLRVAKPRTVPDIVGIDEAQARAMLSDAGLSAKIVYVDTTDAANDGKVISCNPGVGSTVHSGDTVEVTVNRTRTEHLKKAGEAVIRAIYDCGDPSAGDSPIGAALRPHVDPAMLVSGSTTCADASNHQLWYGIVKHWSTLPEGVPAGLGELPRSIVSIEGLTATNDGHVTAAVTVRWDWSVLGAEYAGITSTDTHYVSMDFNDQDLLVAFWDEQTDVPAYEFETAPEEGQGEDGE
ncbi:MAG: PASTA domain-containing protein [Atopobiaceae bacterium]|nr:PASTA domain-containing protein [Atopobiaceae bacterium]